MNDSMRRAGVSGDDATTEYRIREVEARLDRRLSAVEGRRGRSGGGRLAMAGWVVTLAALAFVLWNGVPGGGARTVDSLSTRQVVLHDADGVERGRLSTDPDGRALLSLSDRNGRERIRLTVLADGSPGVTISDPEARPRAVLGYLPDGTTNLVFADAQGTSRAVLGVEPDGSTQAFFADQAGMIRTLVGVGADGAPTVSVFERDEGDEGSPVP